MSLIRVFRYKVYSDEHGSFVDTKIPVWATAEKISEIGAQSLAETSLEVEGPEISEEGFYHDKS